ncbi:MAG: hypothetical protein LUE24_14675 [Lachnospiraceae bacterium]|nr:hypothetical protein [Lachnospiraceae bacterium]
MSDLELIDRLCSVTSTPSDVVRRQAAFIREQLAVDDAVRQEFDRAAEEAERELDIIEYHLRPIHNTERGGNLK